MGAVNISGYTFSTCSTYESPALRIADTHSTVTIQLTTRPRPDDLYTQKVFTISNSDYSYLRPMVTSDSLVRYEGYVSSKSTSGYSGSTSVTSTTATSALVSASLQASVTYTASKTYNSSRVSTSGYTGVSSNSSSTDTSIITKCSIYSAISEEGTFEDNYVFKVSNHSSTYKSYNTNETSGSFFSGGVESLGTTMTFIKFNPYSIINNIVSLARYTISQTTTRNGSTTSLIFAVSNNMFSKYDTILFSYSTNYPSTTRLSQGQSKTLNMPMGGTMTFARSGIGVYASFAYTSFHSGHFLVCQSLSTSDQSSKLYIPMYNDGVYSTSAILLNGYATANIGYPYGVGFAIPNCNTSLNGIYLALGNETGARGCFYTATSVGQTSCSSARYKWAECKATVRTANTIYGTTSNTKDTAFWNSSTTTKSISTTTLSSSAAVANLSSTTALTRSSASGVTLYNSASGSTSLSKTYELASSYYSNNNSSAYNVSTVTTALTSVSTVNAMTSFPSGASSTAKTVNVSLYANGFYRSTNFKYYTKTNYSASSVTNSNGAYTNGNMSSTTALTRTSYYSTTSSTIGSMSSTTSIGSTIRV